MSATPSSVPHSLSETARADAKRTVAPAELVSSTLYSEKGYMINKLQYKVPIDHRPADGKGVIVVTARVVLSHGELDGESIKHNTVLLDRNMPIAVYLVGGPGSDNPPTAHTALNDFYLGKGFQILYMDYRGMGSSHLLRADKLAPGVFGDENAQRGDPDETPRLLGLEVQEQADLLALFRQDNIVRDLEAVRKSLVENSKITSAHKWTLVGQSYGGWVSFTYLSFYPEALHMVLVTGGIPPVGQSAYTVYKHTYNTVIKACDKFYGTYKHHEESVRRILEFIAAGKKDNEGKRVDIAMPGGGVLTPERFLCLGRTLGTTEGDSKVDEALRMCLEDIDEKSEFSDRTLAKIESWLRFEERPLYAILQEPIYAEASLPVATIWAAERVGLEYPQYWWLKEGAFKKVFSPENDADNAFRKDHFDGKRIYLSAEHVHRFHYDQFQALIPLKKAAAILAVKKDWAPLFDTEQLANNTVPISSLSYDNDMFIDWQLSQRTAERMPKASINLDHDAILMHTAVKDRSHLVLDRLWNGLGFAAKELLGWTLTEAELKDAPSVLAALGQAK